MERCMKSEGKKGDGCTKPAGHTGRCRVRPSPQLVVEKEAKAKPSKSSVADQLIALARNVGEVEAEVQNLMQDLTGAMDRMAGKVAEANSRAASTLKSLVKSRRQVQAMLAAQQDVIQDAQETD